MLDDPIKSAINSIATLNGHCVVDKPRGQGNEEYVTTECSSCSFLLYRNWPTRGYTEFSSLPFQSCGTVNRDSPPMLFLKNHPMPTGFLESFGFETTHASGFITKAVKKNAG